MRTYKRNSSETGTPFDLHGVSRDPLGSDPNEIAARVAGAATQAGKVIQAPCDCGGPADCDDPTCPHNERTAIRWTFDSEATEDCATVDLSHLDSLPIHTNTVREPIRPTRLPHWVAVVLILGAAMAISAALVNQYGVVGP